MGKFIKSIVAGVIALSMATWGVPVWAAIQGTPVEIPVTVSIGAAGEYSLSASVSGDGTLNFTTSTVTISDPWRVADDYIDVDLSAPTNASWGLRIVTDNAVTVGGCTRDSSGNLTYGGASEDSDDGTAGTMAGFDLDSTPGAPYSYGGLINTDDEDNPTMRAALAWQVQGYDQSGNVVGPSLPSDPTTVLGGWADDWAYLADKSNSDYRSSDLVSDINTADGGLVVYIDDTNDNDIIDDADDYVVNYTLVAYGTPYGRYLATHPGELGDGDTDTDYRSLSSSEGGSSGNPWDIYVYLCAQFMNTDWIIDPSGTDFVLPAGDYTANINLELFSE